MVILDCQFCSQKVESNTFKGSRFAQTPCFWLFGSKDDAFAFFDPISANTGRRTLAYLFNIPSWGAMSGCTRLMYAKYGVIRALQIPYNMKKNWKLMKYASVANVFNFKYKCTWKLYLHFRKFRKTILIFYNRITFQKCFPSTTRFLVAISRSMYRCKSWHGCSHEDQTTCFRSQWL